MYLSSLNFNLIAVLQIKHRPVFVGHLMMLDSLFYKDPYFWSTCTWMKFLYPEIFVLEFYSRRILLDIGVCERA